MVVANLEVRFATSTETNSTLDAEAMAGHTMTPRTTIDDESINTNISMKTSRYVPGSLVAATRRESARQTSTRDGS